MSDFRTYQSLATAKIAVNTHGCGRFAIRYDVKGKHIVPVILCDDGAQLREMRKKGFKADIKRLSLSIGATVKLKDSVKTIAKGEMAVITKFTKGSYNLRMVHLDRAIGGTTIWNVKDIELVE